MVDKDRIEGSSKQVKDIIKEKAGKLLGDKKMKSEGRATRPRAKPKTP